ncbi:MAG: undecaprenyldiphospho-muramoylpentapeptide beta-N-acetylglucosaminyltransferase [Alphaproteobacteria bacterium]|nr:undecaprenyldiphospho-muramoylpentapeptide beta-N-acetylglucosaminyltransferase [Alphaproteobacteria bacterium]MBV9692820.1 undecaprenyldiphospho-muramoylpentapeptide beta-N-acetylglucosaminyltransferase [Alphaproteobacteria bacterium]
MTTIVLSAGGTGGHLFPAQALAAELVRRGKTIVVMTDRRGSHYTTAFPGAAVETVSSAAFSDRSVLGLLAAPFEILAGILQARAKLMRVKARAVIGFGGYPSLPVMIAAWLGRYPSAVLEQNAVTGRANRAVMNKVRVVAAAFPIARFAPKDRSKIALTGNPLRPEVIALAGRSYEPPVQSGPLRLLVFGGSQGARALSELVPAAVALLPPAMRSRLDIVQQCRPEDIAQVRAAYADAQVKAELASFYHDMPARLAWSQLVIARAGAGTVSELMAIGRPAILIPLPHALDDNQTPNAEILANADAGWCASQRTLTPEKLAGMIERAFSDGAGLARRAANAHALARLDAVERLADIAEDLARSCTRRSA